MSGLVDLGAVRGSDVVDRVVAVCEAVGVGDDLGAGGDAASGDGDACWASGLSADVLVGAGEGVDAVVVAAVREGAELVEERLGVLATDDSDESVAGGGGDRLCADEFVPVTRSARAL